MCVKDSVAVYCSVLQCADVLVRDERGRVCVCVREREGECVSETERACVCILMGSERESLDLQNI